jgi:hypothetical protein
MICPNCERLIALNMPGTMLCNPCAYPERYDTLMDRVFREADQKRRKKDMLLRHKTRDNVSMLG